MRLPILLITLLLISGCEKKEEFETPAKEHIEAYQAQKQACDVKEAEAEESEEVKKQKKIADTLKLRENDIYYGNKDAKVIVHEYSSFTCPHCAMFHNKIFPRIKKDYIDTGKILYINRLLPYDRQALEATIIAHCAPVESRGSFVGVIFDRQENWAFKDNFKTLLENIAHLGGLSQEAIEKCRSDEELKKSLMQDLVASSQILEVEGTPKFFINGKVLTDNYGYDNFAKTLDEALTQADNKDAIPASPVNNENIEENSLPAEEATHDNKSGEVDNNSSQKDENTTPDTLKNSDEVIEKPTLENKSDAEKDKLVPDNLDKK